jgi:hypothetical protein
MRAIMTAIHHSGGHVGQYTNEVSEDVMELSTSEGVLRICAKVKSLRFKNATLRQHTKNLKKEY